MLAEPFSGEMFPKVSQAEVSPSTAFLPFPLDSSCVHAAAEGLQLPGWSTRRVTPRAEGVLPPAATGIIPSPENLHQCHGIVPPSPLCKGGVSPARRVVSPVKHIAFSLLKASWLSKLQPQPSLTLFWKVPWPGAEQGG